MKTQGLYLVGLLVLALQLTPAQAVTLKIATVTPAGSVEMREMMQGAKEIEKRTEGRVRLKLYPGGNMGSEQVVQRKIKIGQLHGGVFSSGGLAGIYPDIQCLNLPLLFESVEEVDYVRTRMEPIMKQNLEQRGFVLLGMSGNGFTRILSKAPLADLDSVRNSKLWAPEGDLFIREAYRSMELNPVYLPISDVYPALHTGLIDTVTITPSLAIVFQWHAKTRYMTDMPLIYLVGFFAVQKRAFDRITPADQAIVREEFDRVVRRLDSITRDDNRRATEALGKQGIELVAPSDAEIARWREFADHAVERMIEGGAVTRETVEQVRRLVADYRNGAGQ